MKISKEAKEFLADKGFDPQYGARPLHRAIQKYLEDPLAEEILNAKIKGGELLEIDFDKEAKKLTIHINTKETPQKKVEEQ